MVPVLEAAGCSDSNGASFLRYLSVSCSWSTLHWLHLLRTLRFYTGILSTAIAYNPIILGNPRWLMDLDAFVTANRLQWNRSQGQSTRPCIALLPLQVRPSQFEACWTCNVLVMYSIVWWHIENLWRSMSMLARSCPVLLLFSLALSGSWFKLSNLIYSCFCENNHHCNCSTYSTHDTNRCSLEAWKGQPHIPHMTATRCYELAVLAFCHGLKRLMTPPVKSDKCSAVRRPSCSEAFSSRTSMVSMGSRGACKYGCAIIHWLSAISMIGNDMKQNFATRVPVVWSPIILQNHQVTQNLMQENTTEANWNFSKAQRSSLSWHASSCIYLLYHPSSWQQFLRHSFQRESVDFSPFACPAMNMGSVLDSESPLDLFPFPSDRITGLWHFSELVGWVDLEAAINVAILQWNTRMTTQWSLIRDLAGDAITLKANMTLENTVQ